MTFTGSGRDDRDTSSMIRRARDTLRMRSVGSASLPVLLIYGSEAPIFHPQWALRAFMDFQIPEDLCAGYGYPQLTDRAKRKILGENLLRLPGLDVAETTARLGRRRT